MYLHSNFPQGSFITVVFFNWPVQFLYFENNFRSDFAAVKEDLAFREDEVEKSRNTLEGLTVQHNQVSFLIDCWRPLKGSL